MSISCFVSAVSKEFHEKDPKRPMAFQSYREVLARSLRILTKESTVATQEDLVQGPGDLLATLDAAIGDCDVVVHLVGEMAGAVPQPAELRRLNQRHQHLLSHEPELKSAIGDGVEVTYTQWEAYLAFEHRVGRFVYKVPDEAPRSPAFVRDPDQMASQQRHFARLERTGEHYDLACFDQLDLARKVVVSVEMEGLRRGKLPPDQSTIETSEDQAAEITALLADALRKSARQANTTYDPAGVENLLRHLDDVGLKVIQKPQVTTEERRQAVLQAVRRHQEELEDSYADAPSYERKYEIALAQLALAYYLEAALIAERLADEEIALYQTQPDDALLHREHAQNALMLQHEALQLANRRDDAIRALERAGALVDIEKEPILWADIHEPLAMYLFDHAKLEVAGELIDQILDIREELQGESDPVLPSSLHLWCRWLYERGDYQAGVDVAARAARLFAQMGELPSVAAALGTQALGLKELARFDQAEPLFRLALAMSEAAFGPDHPEVASGLSNLATLLEHYGQHEEAEQLLRRSLLIDETAHGPDHHMVAIRLNNLASLLQDTGRLVEAESVMLRALAISKAVLGPDHPEVATCLSNLAQLFKATARLGEAEPLMRRALEIAETTFGPEHPIVAGRLNNLAGLLQNTRRLQEAEDLYCRALAIATSRLGKEHPTTRVILANYETLLSESNQA